MATVKISTFRYFGYYSFSLVRFTFFIPLLFEHTHFRSIRTFSLIPPPLLSLSLINQFMTVLSHSRTNNEQILAVYMVHGIFGYK